MHSSYSPEGLKGFPSRLQASPLSGIRDTEQFPWSRSRAGDKLGDFESGKWGDTDGNRLVSDFTMQHIANARPSSPLKMPVFIKTNIGEPKKDDETYWINQQERLAGDYRHDGAKPQQPEPYPPRFFEQRFVSEHRSKFVNTSAQV